MSVTYAERILKLERASGRVRKILEREWSRVIEEGDLDAMQWLYMRGHPFPFVLTRKLVETGRIYPILWILKQKNAQCKAHMMAFWAIRMNQEHITKALSYHTDIADPTLCAVYYAIKFGNLSMLRWLYRSCRNLDWKETLRGYAVVALLNGGANSRIVDFCQRRKEE